MPTLRTRPGSSAGAPAAVRTHVRPRATRWVRRLVPLLAVAVVAASAPASAGVRTDYVPPVTGPVVRSFDPPQTRFGPGHLGLDYAVAPGTAVRAAGPGEVTFAGSVAHGRHVVVLHPDGLRTSYSFLAEIAVRRGARVDRGAVVGRAGGTGPGHDGTVLHFGVRAGDRYLDPAMLFAGVVPEVRLVPTPRSLPRPRADEEAAALAVALRFDPPSWLGPQPGRMVQALSDIWGSGPANPLTAARDVVDAAGDVALAGGRLLASGIEWADAASPLPTPTATAWRALRSTADWLDHRRRCSGTVPAADGTGGSGHRVLVVAGLGSAGGGDVPSVGLPVGRLGYAADDVRWFSYAPDGGRYAAADTHVAVEDAARRMAAELRALEAAEPGREVDLVAHSLGGVVVLAFLALEYDETDPTFPPLGRVVTLASPHAGAPLATAARLAARSEAGRAVLDALAGAALAPPRGAPVLADLAEGSELLARVRAERLAGHLRITTLGAAFDTLVPGDRATVPGAVHHHVVPVLDPVAHEAVLHDDEALGVVRAAIEGRPPPCTTLGAHLLGSMVPVEIARFERGVGQVLAGLDVPG